MLHRFFILVITATVSCTSYGIDIGNESIADKADRFDFENFHEEKGVTLWDDKKGEEKKDKTLAPTSAIDKATAPKTFEKGDTLKVREAYKLGNDPVLATVQSFYEATEALEKQLNARCPNGWVKEQEWRKPEAGYFYIYYQASCL